VVGGPPIRHTSAMPVTFLAHQAPLFPLKRWWRGMDGVAFVAGTLAPDLSTATLNTNAHYLWGYPLWFDGHQLNDQVRVCLPIALLVAWLTRRLLAPGLAPLLPSAGGWHLRDLACLQRGRYRWWVICASALAGSVSHVLLDALTHEPGGPRIGIPGLDATLLTVAGRPLTGGAALQVVASVGLAAYTLVESRRIALRRWDAGPDFAAPELSGPARLAGRVALVGGAVLTGLLASTQLHRTLKIAVMTWAWLGLAVAVLTALGLRLAGRAPGAAAPSRRAHEAAG